MHVKDCDAAKETPRARGVEIRETVPIAMAKRFFIAGRDGNDIEIALTRTAAAG